MGKSHYMGVSVYPLDFRMDPINGGFFWLPFKPTEDGTPSRQILMACPEAPGLIFTGPMAATSHKAGASTAHPMLGSQTLGFLSCFGERTCVQLPLREVQSMVLGSFSKGSLGYFLRQMQFGSKQTKSD